MTSTNKTDLDLAFGPALYKAEDPMTDAFGPILHPKAKTTKSVVPAAVRERYKNRPGADTAAARRSNGDWLAQELESECVRGERLSLDRFLAILDANGVDANRWPNRNHGWEGRLRMSAGNVLRGVVRKTGIFRTPEGETNVVELAQQGDELAREFLNK